MNYTKVNKMKMNTKVEKAFNNQIRNELESEYIYYAMAAYFEEENLPGMATWMNKQAEEEHEHAMKLFKHITERGNRTIFSELSKPPVKWKSPLNAFEEAYKHEQFITKKINELVDISTKEKDHAARTLLNWYVDEQVEEESNALTIVEKLKMVGTSKQALLMLDHTLSKRK